MRYLNTAVLMFLFGGIAMGQTNLSGTIAVDSILSLSGSPYIVTGNLTVYSPHTLKIDSGVFIRFQSGTGLYANGNLQARWVTFTSSKDTAGGAPQKGDWSGIQMGSTGSSSGVFDTCQIKFGGSNGTAELYAYNGNTDVEGSMISGSSTTVSTSGGQFDRKQLGSFKCRQCRARFCRRNEYKLQLISCIIMHMAHTV